MTQIPNQNPERPYKSIAEIRLERQDQKTNIDDDQTIETWMDQLIEEHRSTLETLASL